MYGTRSRWLVCKPNERKNTREKTCSTANLETSVSQNVPVEPETWVNLHFGVGPSIDIHFVTVTESEGINCRVVQKLVMVHWQLCPDTVGKFEVIVNPPLILKVKATKTKTHLNTFRVCSAVTISYTKSSRFCVVDKVIQGSIAVIACSFADIRVVHIDIVVRNTGSQSMFVKVYRKVVYN
ncbi:hypothetical protein SDC9_117551 [bioreactor metagenome]|uniref:Uncharacterized protein n=1 Tax=bioreactor metagenome TaxID=1076179 RepID=A0A645BYJ0_9ZZZZ